MTWFSTVASSFPVYHAHISFPTARSVIPIDADASAPFAGEGDGGGVVGQNLGDRGARCEGCGVEGELIGLRPGEVEDGVRAVGATVGGGAEDEAVGASATGDLIVSCAACEGAVARASKEAVVGRAAKEEVVVVPAREDVGPCAAVEGVVCVPWAEAVHCPVCLIGVLVLCLFPLQKNSHDSRGYGHRKVAIPKRGHALGCGGSEMPMVTIHPAPTTQMVATLSKPANLFITRAATGAVSTAAIGSPKKSDPI